MSLEVERWCLPTREFMQSFKRLPGAKDSFITLSPNSQDEELRKRNGLYRYSNEQLERCLAVMDEEGVDCCLCFAVGLPFENWGHLHALVQYQKRLRKKFRRVRFKNCMIEIEPGSPLSMDPGAFGVELHRSTFADYYRYHRQPLQNHFQELGYDRSEGPDRQKLAAFYCRHFCVRGTLGKASPVVCGALTSLRKLGAFKLFDCIASCRPSPQQVKSPC